MQNEFAKVAADARCRFLGNVRVGRDLSVQELRQAYSAGKNTALSPIETRRECHLMCLILSLQWC